MKYFIVPWENKESFNPKNRWHKPLVPVNDNRQKALQLLVDCRYCKAYLYGLEQETIDNWETILKPDFILENFPCFICKTCGQVQFTIGKVEEISSDWDCLICGHKKKIKDEG